MRNSEGVLREWEKESEREIECVGVLREWEKEIETERCQSQKKSHKLDSVLIDAFECFSETRRFPESIFSRSRLFRRLRSR